MALYELDGLRPTVPANGRYWVAENAVVVGDVTLEDDASVWFGVVARGDNEPVRIGARTNVQDGAVLHTDPGFPLTIGPDCTIGHGAIVHGCTIGAGSLVGMGATILNGAVVGASCLVGAGALVTEGKAFPDFSLIVGSPAKAVRTLGGEWEVKILGSAGRYVAHHRRYAKGLKRID